jgi:hypothetical protein
MIKISESLAAVPQIDVNAEKVKEVSERLFRAYKKHLEDSPRQTESVPAAAVPEPLPPKRGN